PWGRHENREDRRKPDRGWRGVESMIDVFCPARCVFWKRWRNSSFATTRYGSKRLVCPPHQGETRTADGGRFATLAGGFHFIWRHFGLVRGGARLATRSDAPTCARCRRGRGICSCILRRPVGRSVGAIVFENAGYRAVDLRRRR